MTKYPEEKRYWFQRTDKIYLRFGKEPDYCKKLGEHIPVLQMNESIEPHEVNRVCVNCGITTSVPTKEPAK